MQLSGAEFLNPVTTALNFMLAAVDLVLQNSHLLAHNLAF